MNYRLPCRQQGSRQHDILQLDDTAEECLFDTDGAI
jgi:hypothetical protein